MSQSTARLLWALPFIALAFDVAGAQTRNGPTLARHDFTDSAQGWSISGDSVTAPPSSPRPADTRAAALPEGMRPWARPGIFTPQPPCCSNCPPRWTGGSAFSLKQSGTAVSLIDDDIVIVGPAGRLSYRFPTGPGTDWRDYSVRLSASEGWTWNWNARATQIQIQSVLSGPTRLEIRGEYVTGDDEGSLDNFMLTAAPR